MFGGIVREGFLCCGGKLEALKHILLWTDQIANEVVKEWFRVG